jgi:transcriptional regulator
VRLIKLAKRACSERQLEALVLREQGFDERAIGRRLGISHAAAHDRLSSGMRKVKRALRA